MSCTFPLTLSSPLKMAPSAISVFISCDTKNPGKAKVNQFKNVQNAAATGKISQKDALDKIRKIVLSKK